MGRSGDLLCGGAFHVFEYMRTLQDKHQTYLSALHTNMFITDRILCGGGRRRYSYYVGRDFNTAGSQECGTACESVIFRHILNAPDENYVRVLRPPNGPTCSRIDVDGARRCSYGTLRTHTRRAPLVGLSHGKAHTCFWTTRIHDEQ